MRQPDSDEHRVRSPIRAVAWALVAVLGLASPALAVSPAAQDQPEVTPAGQDSDGPEDSESVASQSFEGSTLSRFPSESEAPADPADPSSDAEEPAETATLIFTTDAPCNLIVDGIPRGALEPGESLEIEVESLELRVSATADEVTFARWDEDLNLEPNETREVLVPMLEAIEDLRKRERREQVFRDIDRGLMWTRRDNAKDVLWEKAASYCEDLQLGGFDNWKLPSIEELETLEAIWSIRPLKVRDQLQLTACCLWSSTEGDDNTVWNLDFRFRKEFEVNRSLSYGLRAVCRREMPEEELAEARLAADPKEQKRRLKEKRRRLDERKSRKQEDQRPDGSESAPENTL